jgi:hypothetical protein
MSSREIIARITNEGVYLNPQLIIPMRNTNLPSKDMGFRDTNKELYWRLKMLHYSPQDQCLYVDVINYNSSSTDEFANQIPKQPVSFLKFGQLDWPQLEPLLSHYKLINLKYLLKNIKTDSIYNTVKWEKDIKVQEPKKTYQKTYQKASISQPNQLTEQHSVPINKCRFGLGHISFTSILKTLEEECDIYILNDHIIPEFDTIKSWFSKKLSTKYFNVKTSITIDSENKIILTRCAIKLGGHA